VHVGRDRFLPVKRTSDLLLLMSDRYRLDPDDGRLTLNTSQTDVPLLNLDAAYFDQVF
jgi:UTP--glucose-1-phosphate uridylyltransferase